MNIFNRLTTSIKASLDKAVTQVENHEAIVSAALKQTCLAAAKAKIRHTRVAKDGLAIRNKLEEVVKLEKTWIERARAVAEQDENKALQCVQRRNQCRKQIEQLTQALQTHEKLESNIALSIQQIDERVQELTQQRNMLRSRHSAADAMHIVTQVENKTGTFVNDALERWETAISETEYMIGNSYESDILHESFVQTENDASLRAELACLLSDNKENTHE